MYIDNTEMRRVQRDMLWEQGQELGGKEERQKDGSHCHYQVLLVFNSIMLNSFNLGITESQ